MLNKAVSRLFLVALIALVAVAVFQLFFSDDNEQKHESLDRQLIAPTSESKELVKTDHPTSSDVSAARSDASQALGTVPTQTQPPTSTTLSNEQSDTGRATPSPASVNMDAAGPNARIGISVPISASIQAACKAEIDQYGKDAVCYEVMELREKMAQQPRDLAWATDMETKMRDLIMAESDAYQIRAIECRSTICAVEVAAAYGGERLGRRIANDNAMSWKIMETNLFATAEKDQLGNRITVDFAIFQRR